MDELENRLNSNNPIVIAQIFSKILDQIKDKYVAGSKDCPELKFLKDKCISLDPLISDVAGSGVISLAEDELLQIENTMADFISMIPLTRYYSSLTKVFSNLMHLEMKRSLLINGGYKNAYNLWSPQHPLLIILNEDLNTWKYILNEIRVLYNTDSDGKHLTELFRPVILYVLYNPSKKDLELFKQKLWTFLLNTRNIDTTIIYDILSWMQIEFRENLEMNSEIICEALLYSISSKEPVLNLEILILWQVSILHNLALKKLDIRNCINSLINVLEQTKEVNTINCILLILSNTIEICSSVHMKELLNLCNLLLLYPGKELYILAALKMSLLQWLAHPSSLTPVEYEMANKIYKYIEDFDDSPINYQPLVNFVEEFKTVISVNDDVYISAEICQILPHLKDEHNIYKWLQRIENIPCSLLKKLFKFLCGLFILNSFSSDIQMKLFSIILKYVESNKLLSSQLLTIILFKLSNTKDPKLHFVLLKALPKTVVLKENISKVMATLQALSKGSVDLYNFSLSLMYDAWKEEKRCYNYLENLLTVQKYSEKKWETYVTKTYILKDLCKRRPELYGKDIVAHLSRVLNECSNDDGALPCALAIDGITLLCLAEIIDIKTTWETLSPNFKNERRIPVVKSLCSLIYEIPHLPYTESYPALTDEVVKTLWDYVNLGDPQISEAALNSLTSFSLEQICSQIPETYLDESVLEERRNSVADVPHIVPGRTWVKFLEDNNASKEAGNFLIKMISKEVTSYLKYVYQVKSSREPINYGYLPTHSIVRGLGEFIKTWASKWKGSIHDLLYIECLRIFSMEYSKPLPPLDWCFLQELLHDSRTKEYCINIACHQVILSGTARRLVENYILACTSYPQECDVINVFRNLKHLANSIQPMILKPFFEKAINLALNNYNNDDDKLLMEITKYLVEILQNNDIQETNKITIAGVLDEKISITDIQSEEFNILLKCVILLPTKYLEEMTNLKTNEDHSEEWLLKLMKIRCCIAIHLNTTPLSWLNQIIDVYSMRKRNTETYKEIIQVCRKHINNAAECALWLLELIGQIQAKVAGRCDQKELFYFFNIFILVVVEFSGYSVLIIDENNTTYEIKMKELFPQAFTSLVSVNDWSICTDQALEWFYHMNLEESIPFVYRNIFGITLRCLRHDELFVKTSKWIRYLNSNVKRNVAFE